MRRFYVYLALIVLSIGFLFIIPYKGTAQSTENDTYPMALQRIPTKNMSESGSENDTYPMALQRIPTVPQP